MMPARKHHSWTGREESKLEDMFDQGYTLEQLCDQFERTPNGITNKLYRMGHVKKLSGGRIMRLTRNCINWRHWATVRNNQVEAQG